MGGIKSLRKGVKVKSESHAGVPSLKCSFTEGQGYRFQGGGEGS